MRLDVRIARVSKQASKLDDDGLAELTATAQTALRGRTLRMRRCLVALPVAQREVLLLGYFEGLSSSELGPASVCRSGPSSLGVAAGLSALRNALSDSVSELR